MVLGIGYIILMSRSMGGGSTVGLYTTCMSLVSFPFFIYVHHPRELALCVKE